MTCSNAAPTIDRRTIIPTAAPEFYALLPEFMRTADAVRGYPLKALLAAAQQQANLVDADITVLWQNFFVETCEDWALPYLADLIGVTLIDDLPANNRREVARTIAYRRRKGTVPQLESMANDITGWSVRVAEFFNNLHWTTNMNHLRLGDRWTLDLRDRGALARLGGGFDTATYTADFRPGTQTLGRYNIMLVGFFCYRLQAIPFAGIPAAPAPAPAPAGAFHFDALGQPEPLFTLPAPLERNPDAAWPRVEQKDVLRAIPAGLFAESLLSASGGWLWEQPAGFTVLDRAGVPVTLKPLAADLCDWSAAVTPGEIAIDVRLGRFLVTASDAVAHGPFTTNTFRGLSMPVGGGAYDRSASLSPPDADRAQCDFFFVDQAGTNGAFSTLSAALVAAAASTQPWMVIQIQDSLTYNESLDLPASFANLALQAASGQRPVLTLTAAAKAFTGNAQGNLLLLSGLVFTGAGQQLTLPDGVASIHFVDCTVDPGGGLASDGVSFRPAGVSVDASRTSAGGSVSFLRCMLGPILMNGMLDCLRLTDSIADAQAFAGAPAITGATRLLLQRSTVSGAADCEVLETDLALVDGLVQVKYRQQGCVRFSYFGPLSTTPRRYECAPSLPRPIFTSTFFGDPGYFQLALDGSPAIALGERGSEMGVWSSLANQQRLSHLSLRLQDYLPAGLVPQIIFAN